jgi:dTDP-4-amino-4,6-dideoxygalactose transaminase
LAGIGRGQMIVIDERVEARRKINKRYKENLEGLKEIVFHTEPNMNYYSNFWLTSIIINHKYITREEIRLELEKFNVESRPLWKPMHMQPVFKGFSSYLDGTSEILFEKGLCLPSGSNLKFEKVDMICDIIRKILK